MSKIKLSENFIKDRVKLALAEDLYPDGDITSGLLKKDRVISAKLISICSDSTLGNIHITIRNSKRQLLYDNHSNGNNSFDFKVSATQQLIISLIAPENNLTDELNQPVDVFGCVSAVVGFRF